VLDFQKSAADYIQALTRQLLPFYLKNAPDPQYGGYSDLLSTTGEVIEGDKFVTAQARQAWVFAWLYNQLDAQPAYLQHAQRGGDFLSQFAHDPTLNCYSILDRLGRPIAPAADLVPDCSAVLAYIQLYRATGSDEWAMLAKQTFANLLARRLSVRTEQAGTVGGFRSVRHLSEPTALLEAVLAIWPLLDEDGVKDAVETVQADLMTEFLDRRSDSLREFILPEGAFLNTPEGRRQHVGLTFRVISAQLSLCAEPDLIAAIQDRNGARKLASQVVNWGLRVCEQAWDETAGGLVAFTDLKNQPTIFPDARHKWAWVHTIALAALIKSYYHTRQPDCLKWFRRIQEYVFRYFPDPTQPGWHMVLDQTNQPLASAKATPAAESGILIHSLAETAQTLSQCAKLPQKGQRKRPT